MTNRSQIRTQIRTKTRGHRRPQGLHAANSVSFARACSRLGLLLCIFVSGALAWSCAYAQASTTGEQTGPASQDLAAVGGMGVEAQVTWLQQATRAHRLDALDDAQLVNLFKSLKPETIPIYIGAGRSQYSDYEFTMLREERIGGKWPAKPDHMLVRCQREPLRIYAKWLPDGAHAGQEIIYDETKRHDQMYGHLGGVFNIMPLWTALDSSLARAQSNHSVRDLGLAYVADRYLEDAKKFQAAGTLKPADIEVTHENGKRVVVMT